ncbi:MAG: hypothetical protein R3D57_11685 [Hyphomicrobiaceae bacterium]
MPAALPLLLAMTPSAVAEPVLDRVFSEADVVATKTCAVMRIGFNFRVRYISHFPLSNGTELRIAFRAVDPAAAKAEILTRRESLRVPSSQAEDIQSIEFEIAKGSGLSVLVTFKHPVAFDVAQGADFESLNVAMARGKATSACKPVFPASAIGTGKWQAEISDVDVPATPVDEDSETGGGAGKVTKLVRDAQKAMSAGDYDAAIRLATKASRQKEADASPEAKELLGLARERKGQTAHARAEYEEYLARYPDGEGADRVRRRLAGLDAKPADSDAPDGSSPGASPEDEDGSWRVSGSLSQYYIRDEGMRKFRDPSLPPDLNEDKDDHDTFQNELLNGLDLNAEWRTGMVRSKARFSGALEDGFEEGDGDIGSIASAYIDSAIPNWGVSAKLGRQTRNTGGVIGRFDGGLASWQANPQLRFNVIAGSPVEHRRDLPFKDDSIFYGLSADIGGFYDGFDATVYAIEQDTDGLVDRQAIGGELRYSNETTSAFALLDYDVHYNEVNMAIGTASWTAPDKSTFNFSADYRKSPFLLTQNALLGQGYGSLADMLTFFSADEIEQLANDRSARATTYSVGYSKPLNEMFQINLDATLANISATPASGGVDAMPSTGNEYYYSALLLANGVIRENDTFTLGLRYADRESSNAYALDIGSRYPVTSDLRISPRIRFGYREGELTDWTEVSVMPTVRLNYNWFDDVGLELEAGAKWSERQEGTATSEDVEYFILLGYHYDFDVDDRTFAK